MIEQITKQINELLTTQNRVVVAIDGDSAAGKTTLAEHLTTIYDCNVIHLDHFFLPPSEHTDLPAGNIDFDRLVADVLTPLLNKADFQYQPFDCQSQTFDEPISFINKSVTIIEGAYAHHPALANHYDLTIFLAIKKELQHERILKRNGAVQLERFVANWIPREKLYNETFDIVNQSDLVFEVG